jgi:hypothetical protein
MSDKCKKCGTTITVYNDKISNSIRNCLCTNCWLEWQVFHDEHSDEIHKTYSCGRNGHRATWSVFLGELPNKWKFDRERVEFT